MLLVFAIVTIALLGHCQASMQGSVMMFNGMAAVPEFQRVMPTVDATATNKLQNLMLAAVPQDAASAAAQQQLAAVQSLAATTQPQVSLGVQQQGSNPETPFVGGNNAGNGLLSGTTSGSIGPAVQQFAGGAANNGITNLAASAIGQLAGNSGGTNLAGLAQGALVAASQGGGNTSQASGLLNTVNGLVNSAGSLVQTAQGVQTAVNGLKKGTSTAQKLASGAQLASTAGGILGALGGLGGGGGGGFLGGLSGLLNTGSQLGAAAAVGTQAAQSGNLNSGVVSNLLGGLASSGALGQSNAVNTGLKWANAGLKLAGLFGRREEDVDDDGVITDAGLDRLLGVGSAMMGMEGSEPGMRPYVVTASERSSVNMWLWLGPLIAFIVGVLIAVATVLIVRTRNGKEALTRSGSRSGGVSRASVTESRGGAHRRQASRSAVNRARQSQGRSLRQSSRSRGHVARRPSSFAVVDSNNNNYGFVSAAVPRAQVAQSAYAALPQQQQTGQYRSYYGVSPSAPRTAAASAYARRPTIG